MRARAFGKFGLAIVAGALLAVPASAQAGIRVVDWPLDDPSINACTPAPNDCSLRGAINTIPAGNNDTIALGADTYFLNQGKFTIGANKHLKIVGRGANLTTIDGNTNPTNTGIFWIRAGATATISAVKLAKGHGFQGGAIEIETSATVTIANSALTDNRTDDGINGFTGPGTDGGSGGAIWNAGTLNISNSTFSSNSTGKGGSGGPASSGTGFKGGDGGDGGAIWSSGTLTISNSTFGSNTTGEGGPGGLGFPDDGGSHAGGLGGDGGDGGAIVSGGPLTISQSTIAANTTGKGGAGGQGAAGTTGGTGGSGGKGAGVAVSGSGTPAVSGTLLAGGQLGVGGVAGPAGGGTIGTAGANGTNANCSFTINPSGTGNLAWIGAGDRGGCPATASFLLGNPLIGSVTSNGGTTPTMSLSPGSAAINANAGAFCSGTDQRGFVRPIGAGCDIGAIEIQAAGNTDGDSFPDGSDNCDEVPNNNQAANFDNDSEGDACDADDDGDNVFDNGDNCLLFASTDQTNTDADNFGNVCDPDDDNDGFVDNVDWDPLNPAEWLDSDNDGTGNNADLNDDNDSAPDLLDAFPLNPAETLDTDGDHIGNNADTDDDGDGVLDANDAFPLNAAETIDTDGDFTGNNADSDDDDDGVIDLLDAFPLNAAESADTDGDGVGNNADGDDDGDGVPDAQDSAPLDRNQGVAVFSITPGSTTVNEGGTATFTVKRTGWLAKAVTVTVESQAGTAKSPGDFAPVSVVVQFAAGETTKTVATKALDDKLAENDESYGLVLSAPSAGGKIAAPTSATVRIVGNDRVPTSKISSPSRATKASKLRKISGTAVDLDGDLKTVEVAISKGKAPKKKPRFVKATLKKGKWTLKLKTPLEPGNWTIISRATDKQKLRETKFSTKAKNRRTIKVK